MGDRVELIEAGEPRPLAGDEVLLEVMAAGVGNWDEFVRAGSWDVGAKPPMALGVEAAGTVAAAGHAVSDWAPGDAVMTHPVPLRDQGTWAPRLIAPAGLLARKPHGASWEAAAAFPVPALTAEQVLSDALNIRAGEQLPLSRTRLASSAALQPPTSMSARTKTSCANSRRNSEKGSWRFRSPPPTASPMPPGHSPR